MKLFGNILIVILFLSGLNSFAQKDLDSPKKIPLKTNTVPKKVAPSTTLLKTKKRAADFTPPKIADHKPKNNENFLLQTLPEDKDITGKRYWKGKDVTHQKLATAMSLGTVSTKSKKVTVECRDHSYVDGDRVRIFVNNKPVENNVGLKGYFFTVDIILNEGYNRIDFKALNQGLSGPNTAEFRLYDQNGNLLSSKQWGLLTGETATLGVIKMNSK